jgi:hypothetical protein
MTQIPRWLLAVLIALAVLSLVTRIISMMSGEGTGLASDLAYLCSQGTIILLAVAQWGRS